MLTSETEKIRLVESETVHFPHLGSSFLDFLVSKMGLLFHCYRVEGARRGPPGHCLGCQAAMDQMTKNVLGMLHLKSFSSPHILHLPDYSSYSKCTGFAFHCLLSDFGSMSYRAACFDCQEIHLAPSSSLSLYFLLYLWSEITFNV